MTTLYDRSPFLLRHGIERHLDNWMREACDDGDYTTIVAIGLAWADVIMIDEAAVSAHIKSRASS